MNRIINMNMNIHFYKIILIYYVLTLIPTYYLTNYTLCKEVGGVDF